MSLYRVPPVGNRLPLKGLLNKTIDFDEIFSNYTPFFLDSGTSALAIAINQAKKSFPGKTEIIIPAYTCPDVISAIYYAECTPVLVDFVKDKPFLNLEDLDDLITENTLAIIAINFLGLQEQITSIRSKISRRKILIIEDSAQSAPWRNKSHLLGDLAILSFGRGKPESVLSGGAVLVSNELSLENPVEIPLIESGSTLSSALYALKVIIYNILLSPIAFSLICKIPQLKIGETIFHPLVQTRTMPLFAKRMLSFQIKNRKTNKNISRYIHESLKNLANKKIVDLPFACDWDQNTELLRYPILLPTEKIKRTLVQTLANVGVSEMYPTVLPNIVGLDQLSKKDYPNALDFSNRLITLPCHRHVKQAAIDKIMSELEKL